jgi:hypothetical protein
LIVQVVVDDALVGACLASARCAYWASSFSFDARTLRGAVVEKETGRRVQLSPLRVDRGMRELAERFPKLFARLQTGDADGDVGDVLLQLCAGITWKGGPKYG